MINVEKNFEENVSGKNNIAKSVFQNISTTGDYLEVYGKDAIANEIRNLLMTPRGQYPFDPEYGTLLYKQLFEHADEDTEKVIYYEVRERVLKYVDGISVDAVEMHMDSQNKFCRVDVYYTILEKKNKTKLSVKIKNAIDGQMYSSIDDPIYKDFRF